MIPPGLNFPEKVIEGEQIKPTSEDGVWKWTYKRFKEELDSNNIIFKKTKTSALVDENGKQSNYNIYNKLWLSEQQAKGKVPGNLIEGYENRKSSAELKEISIPFDYSKPSNLIRYLIELVGVKNSELVLDFFSGASTTAQAVMEANANDIENIGRHIMVQLPEVCPENTEAAKAGYKTIAEISKKRIRRAGKKIKEDNADKEGIDDLDIGFRVFKLDSSNIKEWRPKREDIAESLEDHAEHIKGDRTEDDLLYELLLKLGLDLCIPIEQKEFADLTVHNIGAGTLFVCLATEVKAEAVEALAEGIATWAKEYEVDAPECVFRDSGFADNKSKSNLTAILNQNGIKNIRSI